MYKLIFIILRRNFNMSSLPNYIKGTEKDMQELMNDVYHVMKAQYNVDYAGSLELPYAMTVVTLVQAMKFLKKKPAGTRINFGNVLTLYCDNMESEDAEKAGNLVPGCEFGEVAKLELKNDEVTEDDEAE